MDTVTYPDPRTVQCVNDYMIGLSVDVGNDRDLAMDFAVRYTPTVVTLDEEGSEQERLTGFQPPQEFVPTLLLGIGKAMFNRNRFQKALTVFRKLLDQYPQSGAAVQAAYLRDACLAKGAV
jgi:thioredoxin-related protein